MRQGGQIAARVLKETVQFVRPGMSSLEIDRYAEKAIERYGGRPSFKGFEGYPFAVCINVNAGVVHGVPKPSIVIREHDLIKLDLGVFYRGFHTDTATSFVVGRVGSDGGQRRFIEAGRQALMAAIRQCRVGRRLGDVSAKIEEVIEKSGYSVVEELVGHGVGRSLHEDPQVPGVGRRSTGLIIKEGMVLAIEVIYREKPGSLRLDPDGWTLSTDDARIAGLFEHTVAVGRGGVEVLTL